MRIEKVEEKPLRYLKSFVVDYRDKAGQLRKWELVSRGDRDRLLHEINHEKDYSDGCMIVAWNESRDKVAMVKEYRVAKNDYVYSFPAGLGDENETIEDVAKREFKEETGLVFHYEGKDRARYTSIGLSNEIVHTVFGSYSGQLSQEYLEDSEDIEPLEVDREQAIRLLREETVTIRSAFLLLLIFDLPIQTLFV